MNVSFLAFEPSAPPTSSSSIPFITSSGKNYKLWSSSEYNSIQLLVSQLQTCSSAPCSWTPQSMSFPRWEIPSLWLNINVGGNLGDVWLQRGMTVIWLDCDICWITATQGSNRIVNDRRNGGIVSYINKASQITQSGLDIDKEMLYNARLYQQGDALVYRAH